MSALTASLCSTLLFVGVFVFVSADQKTITADSGQDVTLTCRAPNNKITILEWSRADLGDENVFLHQEGHFVPDNQHPSFKNRVDLQDRQMKDGDVSLILKDVTINDSGTYECHVFMNEIHSWKLIGIIHLHVDPPDQKTITAESGQDVTLTCRAPNNNKIIVVKWSRADLGDKNVLLHQDGHFDPEGQHPSFKNRVDLQDKQMKDGDVSLILKDVTINDTGTYECCVVQRVGGHMTLINTTYLIVVPPGQTGGHTEYGSVGLKAGLAVSAVLLCAAVLLVVSVVGGVVVLRWIRNRRINRRIIPNPENPQPSWEDRYIDDLKMT